MAAMTAAQRTAVAARLTEWLAANYELGSYTSTGADLLAFADKLRRYALRGDLVDGKYDLTLGAMVATSTLSDANKARVRTHCTGG